MTYLRPSNRTSRPKPLVYAAVIAVVLAALVQIIFPHFFPAILASIAAPFWRTEFSLESGSLQSPQSLLKRNQELEQELLAAEVRLAAVKLLEQENADLKAAMGRATTTDRILAAVLKRPPFAAYDTLVIDIGNDHGAAVGQRVYAPGNVYIGVVSDVLEHTAKVKLLSSPGEQYEVSVAEAGTPAVAHGRGGGQYLAELPSDVVVEDGDLVFSKNFGDAPFGIVTAVVKDPTQPFETILFAPPINIYELRWVLVDLKLQE